MYANLMAEYARKNLKPHMAIMDVLGCSEKTARNKINGITPITVPEAVKIKETTFSNEGYTIDYLFKVSVEIEAS